ncbi:Adenosylcobinamide-phosphate synthase [hydrothermal vent metagenome]|uniref:Adenosylcobinamide-phosphate synthase n=1 Tax=hydrothermal vent metagenome TaxID=652676 RepID=A0A3B0RJG9_9ZZZZ
MTFLLLAALILDALFGEFHWLWRHIGHPVTWMAALLLRGEGLLNRPVYSSRTRKIYGTLWFGICLIFWTGAAAGLHYMIYAFLPAPWGDVTLITLASIFLAYGSLMDHVTDVRDAILSGDLAKARAKTARIVGRDTTQMDMDGLSRAGIESLAENFSDGVVAPAVFFLIGGLPGIVAYKMTNTADSMIGHRTERFEDFGWAAARCDDLLNFIPARLTALLLALGGLSSGKGPPRRALSIAVRDNAAHASPNAGWPEATMAGLLGVRLGGPRHYADGKQKDSAWLGNGEAGGVPALAPAMTITRAAWLTGCTGLALGYFIWR